MCPLVQKLRATLVVAPGPAAPSTRINSRRMAEIVRVHFGIASRQCSH